MIQITKEAAQKMMHLLHYVKLEIPVDDDEMNDAITTLQSAIEAPEQANDLHAAIMNIPCNPADVAQNFDISTLSRTELTHYKLGHKDARHAAAELALAQPERDLRQIAEFGELQNAQAPAPLIGCVQHDCSECLARLEAPQARELSDAEIGPMVRVALFKHMNNASAASKNDCIEVVYEVAHAVLAAREGK